MAPNFQRPDADPVGDGSTNRGPRGIQSVEVGGQLLKALVRSGQRMPLKDLARAADMTPAKAHPYLVSFGKLGLIEQDEASGHYGLGPLAVQLGLISLQQVDPVRLAMAALPDLAQTLACTVSVAVWGVGGPIIVGVEESPGPVHVRMRHGTPASLRHTGTGKVFSAFMSPALVEAALKAEGEPQAWSDPAFQAELAQVRQSGLSVVREELIAGVRAMAAPVFDGHGRLVLALAAIAPSALLDLSPHGPQAQALQACAARLSARLGHEPASLPIVS